MEANQSALVVVVAHARQRLELRTAHPKEDMEAGHRHDLGLVQ
jgi:hypothetical protein